MLQPSDCGSSKASSHMHDRVPFEVAAGGGVGVQQLEESINMYSGSRSVGSHRDRGNLIADDEGSGHHENFDSLCCSLRASGHAMALGDAADNQRVSAEDNAGQLRLH